MPNGSTDNDPRWPRLMSLAGHELRTPFSVVTGYLRMLERFGPLTDQQRRNVQEIERSAARIKAVLDEMSELVSFETGRAKLNRGRVEFGTLLEDVIAALAAEPEREIVVTLINDAPDAAVYGDPVRLRTALRAVLWALLRELITSTHLVVRLRRQSGTADSFLRVSIADDQRVDALDAAEPPDLVRFFEWRGGCGLSLPIARRVIAAHDGQLWSPTADPSEVTTEDNIDRASRAGAVIVLPEM